MSDYNESIACEYCGLCHQQSDGNFEDGEWNDSGWWCRDCIRHGHKRTAKQGEWALFAQDYPEFAAELKRLRKAGQE